MTATAHLSHMNALTLTAFVVVLMCCCVSARAQHSADTSHGRQNLPGEVTTRYSSVQDSIYKWALQMPVSGRVRFSQDVRVTSYTLESKARLIPQETAWESITRTMNIPASIWAPTPQEVVQRQITIANAQYVPNILLYPMGTGNMQVNLSDIGQMLGLQEDVSPRIRYLVDETTEITIVIYSTQARIIMSLFNGIQAPGQYEIVWNGQDDNGRAVYPGDYVAEVRIGTDRIARKRITWPPR